MVVERSQGDLISSVRQQCADSGHVRIQIGFGSLWLRADCTGKGRGAAHHPHIPVRMADVVLQTILGTLLGNSGLRLVVPGRMDLECFAYTAFLLEQQMPRAGPTASIRHVHARPPRPRRARDLQSPRLPRLPAAKCPRTERHPRALRAAAAGVFSQDPAEAALFLLLYSALCIMHM